MTKQEMADIFERQLAMHGAKVERAVLEDACAQVLTVLALDQGWDEPAAHAPTRFAINAIGDHFAKVAEERDWRPADRSKP